MFSFRKLLKEVSILKGISQDMLEIIITNLKEEIYLPNDVIIKAGTPGDCLYFLNSGTACVLTSTGKEV